MKDDRRDDTDRKDRGEEAVTPADDHVDPPQGNDLNENEDFVPADEDDD